MIILLRSDDLNPDPRVEKYVNFYKEKALEYLLIGWNRSEDIKPQREDALFFEKKAGYGKGARNIVNLILWNWYLLKILLKRREDYQLIHACDFDTMLPTVFMKLFWGKKVVFDVFDWYTDSRQIGNKIVKKVLKTVEQWVTKKSDFIIICEEERIVQLPKDVDVNKVHVHRNLPDNMIEVDKSANMDEKKRDSYVLSYVGVFDSGRGLKELLEAVSHNKQVVLHMAGFGRLTNIVQNYAAKYDNIKYHGAVKHDQAMALMGSSDIIVGMYYTINRNHILAAPNKYYEALFLGKPLLTNVGTIVGDRTLKYQTGYAIEEGKEAILKFMADITEDKNRILGRNAKDLFEKKFRNSSADFLNNEYLLFVHSLL